jgi:hypothetical protein
VNRVTIGLLPVRELSDSGSTIYLPPGTLLTDCKVVCDRASIEDEPYQVLFSVQGREFVCPLYAFQPRTECRLADAEQSTHQTTAVAV